MGKRTGRLSEAKPHHFGSKKRFLLTGMEDSLDASDSEASPPGVCISPQHQAGLRHSSPASSCGFDYLCSRGSWSYMDVAALVSGLPTKNKLASMLKRSIKKEFSSMRMELAHTLQWVEDKEQRLNHHHTAISDLQAQVHRLAMSHHMTLYKLEDQENHNRRNNFYIRGLPEAIRDEDLADTVRENFNSILGKPVTEVLLFDHVHRAFCPRNITTDAPRDVICWLHYYTDKEAIMKKIAGHPLL